jgi:hypothetical protein
MSPTARQIVLACGVVFSADVMAQPRWPRVSVGDIVARAAVRASLDGAVQRLHDPDCSRELSGLRGSGGESLGATLGRRSLGWAEYLRVIYFSEGSAESPCQRQNVLAFTAVNSRVVFICSKAFIQLRRKSIWHAEAVIIHEVLHTLGLPHRNDRNDKEDKDQDITEQVLRVCHK